MTRQVRKRQQMKQEPDKHGSHHGGQIKVSLTGIVPGARRLPSCTLRPTQRTPRVNDIVPFRKGAGELTHPLRKGGLAAAVLRVVIRRKLERVDEVQADAGPSHSAHHGEAADRTARSDVPRELVSLPVLVARLARHVAADQHDADGLLDGRVRGRAAADGELAGAAYRALDDRGQAVRFPAEQLGFDVVPEAYDFSRGCHLLMLAVTYLG